MSSANVEILVTPDELKVALDLPDGVDESSVAQVCGAANRTVCRFLDDAKGPHVDHDNDKEAALAVAIQVWGARQAPGGQMVGLDLAPYISPHLLGPGLISRVNGLIGECRFAGGAVVG